jgi:hypothetical protein
MKQEVETKINLTVKKNRTRAHCLSIIYSKRNILSKEQTRWTKINENNTITINKIITQTAISDLY